jgi:hypothetical protein
MEKIGKIIPAIYYSYNADWGYRALLQSQGILGMGYLRRQAKKHARCRIVRCTCRVRPSAPWKTCPENKKQKGKRKD